MIGATRPKGKRRGAIGVKIEAKAEEKPPLIVPMQCG